MNRNKAVRDRSAFMNLGVDHSTETKQSLNCKQAYHMTLTIIHNSALKSPLYEIVFNMANKSGETKNVV